MRFRALHPDMGVVVEDFDLQSDPSEPKLRLLRSAYEQHHPLLFRPGRALPPERQLAGKTVRHRLPATQEFGDDWPDFCADQPLCLPHPRSGQPVLFVTEEHAKRIHEFPAVESARVLDALFAELYAPAREPGGRGASPAA